MNENEEKLTVNQRANFGSESAYMYMYIIVLEVLPDVEGALTFMLISVQTVLATLHSYMYVCVDSSQTTNVYTAKHYPIHTCVDTTWNIAQAQSSCTYVYMYIVMNVQLATVMNLANASHLKRIQAVLDY